MRRYIVELCTRKPGCGCGTIIGILILAALAEAILISVAFRIALTALIVIGAFSFAWCIYFYYKHPTDMQIPQKLRYIYLNSKPASIGIIVGIVAAILLVISFTTGDKQTSNHQPAPHPTAAVSAHTPTVLPTAASASVPTPAVASDMDVSHTELVKSLYNELIEKCSYYENSYNEAEFNAFLTDWNTRRISAQEKLTDENADISLKMLIGDLSYLETELRNKVTGKDFDSDYIKMVADKIAELQ